MKILVLAGGPDRERPVSLQSGDNVAQALQQAGHEVVLRDILPDDLSALDDIERQGFGVVFPVLHGSWGEGGGLQHILDDRRLPYVGTQEKSARLCMNKYLTKERLVIEQIPTPEYEYLAKRQRRTLALPVVVKAVTEGSSIDLAICHTTDQWSDARRQIATKHDHLLVEKFIKGKELTVGVIAAGDKKNHPGLSGCMQKNGYLALPAIHIIPATEFYDYKAKYIRNDTQYRFDIDLPAKVLEHVAELALATHHILGCRDFSRVDFMVDQEGWPWVLEVNTIPGFTSHSLLPKAARQVGLDFSMLTDHLAQLAWQRHQVSWAL